MNKLSRRSVLTSLAVAPSALRALASNRSKQATRLFLGTYTERSGKPSGSQGIYTCPWDAERGELGPIEMVAAEPNPTFLAIKPGMLISANETNVYKGSASGSATAFVMSPTHGKLRELNTVSSGAAGPCHLALDQTGKALFIANYAGGALASYRVTAKGLSEPVSVLRFTGHSIDQSRQEAAHTHCVLLSPDNRFLLVNDLGLDRIMVFRIHPETAAMTPAEKPYWSAAPGSGPRHSTFHPNGKWVYSVNELNSTVDHLAWNAASGELTAVATVSTLPEEVKGEKNAPAEVTIDRTGRFLYLSNRFHDSIGVFAIDQQTGALTHKQDISCGGKTPRHFALDPSERWVLVTNQDSRNIVVFERNQTTGKLKATGRSYTLDAPVCVLFA